MNHEQRTKIARRDNVQLSARVIRNIAEIEADFYHAAGPVSDRIMLEAVQLITKIATPPWQVIEAGSSAQIVCPEWKMTRGVGIGDMWLELSEFSADEDDRDHSWLAAAVKAGPTQLCIELMFRNGLRDLSKVTLRDDKAVAELLKLGFVRDETDQQFFVPIDIPAELLAQGFEQNDLDAALAPVGKALEKAIAAKGELDKLLEKVRAAAKRP
ncbi:hypothetical protein [Sphingomonas immobilis]|uniref:Uncharacterized protein n=1 Tax=Sphingomonas immobilis TaxID=3063997 RepID=A0ABT9A1Q8_9SPHN|nr:hypothetical protein [Sphingomonas sp. CA1-15]MDO7843764.1 hypothetical protein [Sphingomonas sp. CA1-15]